MARLNARQKRAAKRRLSLHELAVVRNPSSVASEGRLRSSTDVKVHLTAYQAPKDNWEGRGQKPRKSTKRWGQK